MSAHNRSRANTFAALPLERWADNRDDADWIAQRSAQIATRFILLRADGHALVRSDNLGLLHLDIQQCQRLLPDLPPSYLGAHADAEHFLLVVESADAERIATELGAGFIDLRNAGLHLPALDAGLFAYARALAHWQSRTRFCSFCGAPVQLVSAGHRAKCKNPQCGIEHFPRTDPAIIVIVSHGERCLLGRQASWAPNRFSTLAGFVEPGETLEDTVRREVFEEAGVRVVDSDYHSSQPWPFPASIMLGFTARADDPTINVGPELSEARWFSVDDIVTGLRTRELVLPPPLSVSHRLIEYWLKNTADRELAPLMHDVPWLGPRSTLLQSS